MGIRRWRAGVTMALVMACVAACATPPVDRAQGASGAAWRAGLERGGWGDETASWRWPQRDAGGAGQGVAHDAAAARQKIGRPYQINGVWYVPARQDNYHETGVASWYGAKFHGRATANGEVFDMNAISAAHTTLPLPSMVRVTNLENGESLVVRVNDRGPFVNGRIIDLSRAAARELGFEKAGTARVRVRYLGPAGGDAPALNAAGPVGRRAEARVADPTFADAAAAPDAPQRQVASRAGFTPTSLETVRRQSDALQRVVLRPWRDFMAAEAARRDEARASFADAAIGRR